MNTRQQILELYNDLPYHNAALAKTVNARSLFLAEKVDASSEILDFASLGIGVGFARCNSLSSPFETSAAIIKKLLFDNQYSLEFAGTISQTIKSLNPCEYPKSLEAKILRAAYLKGFATDNFATDQDKLFAESGESDYRIFFKKQIYNLMRYMWISIHLTDNYFTERMSSAWHEDTLTNTVKHFRNLFDEPVIIEIGTGANPCKLFDNVDGLVIGVEPKECLRNWAIDLLVLSKAIELVVPGTGRCLPIKFCPDEIRFYNTVLHHPESLSIAEIARVACQKIIVTESNTPWEGSRLFDTRDSIKRIANYVTKANYHGPIIKPATHLHNADPDAFSLTFFKEETN